MFGLKLPNVICPYKFSQSSANGITNYLTVNPDNDSILYVTTYKDIVCFDFENCCEEMHLEFENCWSPHWTGKYMGTGNYTLFCLKENAEKNIESILKKKEIGIFKFIKVEVWTVAKRFCGKKWKVMYSCRGIENSGQTCLVNGNITPFGLNVRPNYEKVVKMLTVWAPFVLEYKKLVKKFLMN